MRGSSANVRDWPPNTKVSDVAKLSEKLGKDN